MPPRVLSRETAYSFAEPEAKSKHQFPQSFRIEYRLPRRSRGRRAISETTAAIQTSNSRIDTAPETPPRIRPRSEHPISRRQIDPDALKVLYRLSGAGYKAYLVGGSVRDLLLSRRPKDFDIGTDAHPQALRRLFRNCRLIGRRFRLAHILFAEGKVIEVATFRRRPEPLDPNAPELLMTSDNVFGTRPRGRPAAGFHDQRALLRHRRLFRDRLRGRPGGPRGGPHPHDRRSGHPLPRGPGAHDAGCRVREPPGVRHHAGRLRGDPALTARRSPSPRRPASPRSSHNP